MVAALTLSAAVLALASAATATAASAAVAEPTSLFFSLGFSSRSVLPRAPASALIYGGGAAGPSCTGVQLVLHSSSRAVVSIVKADLIGHSGSWAAHLPPRSAGFGYSLNATCSFDGAPVARQPDSIELTDVAFGDTLLCTGQSNMWLPMSYTFDRFQSYKEVEQDGKYSGIRLFNFGFAATKYIPTSSSERSRNWDPWVVRPGDMRWELPSNESLPSFGSTCWYTGKAIVDGRKGTADADVPLGLLLSSVGGTQISQWARVGSLDSCTDLDNVTGPGPGSLFDLMIAPFMNVSFASILWYQGENDLGAKIDPGSVETTTGYACALANMMADWRGLWQRGTGINSPVVVFGIAPGGGEGDAVQLPEFRLAQTTGFGTLPSAALPNSYFVPTHDVGDPCNKHSKATVCTGSGKWSDTITHFRDSRIHPRCKDLIGRRAAAALLRHWKQNISAAVSPVLRSCQILGSSINITFEGAGLSLRSPFPMSQAGWSAIEVYGRMHGYSHQNWYAVNLTSHNAHCLSISVDVSKMDAVSGVRYGWSEEPCCAGTAGHGCTPGSCALWGDDTLLFPAIPFTANISAGHCHCVSPQNCSALRTDDDDSAADASPLARTTQLMCQLRREPTNVPPSGMLFTWAYPPLSVPVASHQLTIFAQSGQSSTVIWSSGLVHTAAASMLGPKLNTTTVYWWLVRYGLSREDSRMAPWSEPARFSTSHGSDTWAPATFWLPSRGGPGTAPSLLHAEVMGHPAPIDFPTYALFRRKIAIRQTTGLTSALLYVSAAETHKLLASYILYINGAIISMGPGRGLVDRQGNSITVSYDGFDITSIASNVSEIVIALQTFAPRARGQMAVELRIAYDSGEVSVITDGKDWKCIDASKMFGPIGSQGTQYYNQPHVFYDNRYSAGRSGNSLEWTWLDFDDSAWNNATNIDHEIFYSNARLSPKITPPLSVILQPAVELTQEGPGHWSFQMRKEIQGGIRLAVADGVAGATATIRLGEEMLPNTSLPMYRMRTGNLYQDVWTLRDGHNTVSGHEYSEFRYGEVIFKPATAHLCGRAQQNHPAYIQCPTKDGIIKQITFASYGMPLGDCDARGQNTFQMNTTCNSNTSLTVVRSACVGKHRCEISTSGFGPDPCHGGDKSVAVAVLCNETFESRIQLPVHPPNITAWVVQYPFDDSDSTFTSSDPSLDEVYEFSKYTVKATNLDMWTDSNTRQRDVACNEANGIVTLMQSSVALEFSSQRFTSQWILETRHAETSFAEWMPISISYLYNDVMTTGNLSQCVRYYELVKNYTLEAYIDSEVGLVNVSGLRAPEIDWPSNMRDCHVATSFDTIVNAYAARASMQMAQIAAWLGNHEDAARFNRTFSLLRTNLNSLNFNTQSGKFCDGLCEEPPTTSGNVRPKTTLLSTNHTAWHSSVFMLAFGLVDEDKIAGVFEYVLERLFANGSTAAKCPVSPAAHPQGHWPAPSAGMPGNVYSAFFALQALYRHDANCGHAGLRLLTSTRANTWIGQMRSGATTTKEAWSSDEKPNLTWSHPWGASPALAIPAYLLGITATAPGFAEVRIKPQLGSLTRASGKLPTIRGPITITAQQPFGGSMTISVCLPGGVDGEVWLVSLGETLCIDGNPRAALAQANGYRSVRTKGCAVISTSCDGQV